MLLPTATENDTMTTQQITECFQFLDALRESGTVNMMSGGTMLQQVFGMEAKDARKVFGDWMTTFDPDISAADRAQSLSA